MTKNLVEKYLREAFRGAPIAADNSEEPGVTLKLEVLLPTPNWEKKRLSSPAGDETRGHRQEALGKAICNKLRKALFGKEMKVPVSCGTGSGKSNKLLTIIAIDIAFDPETDNDKISPTAQRDLRDLSMMLRNEGYLQALMNNELKRSGRGDEVRTTPANTGDLRDLRNTPEQVRAIDVLNALTQPAGITWEQSGVFFKSSAHDTEKYKGIPFLLSEDLAIPQDTITPVAGRIKIAADDLPQTNIEIAKGKIDGNRSRCIPYLKQISRDQTSPGSSPA